MGECLFSAFKARRTVTSRRHSPSLTQQSNAQYGSRSHDEKRNGNFFLHSGVHVTKYEVETGVDMESPFLICPNLMRGHRRFKSARPLDALPME